MSEYRAQADVFGHIMAGRYEHRDGSWPRDTQVSVSSQGSQRRGSMKGMTKEILGRLKLTPAAAFCVSGGVQMVNHFCPNMELG